MRKIGDKNLLSLAKKAQDWDTMKKVAKGEYSF